MSVATVSRVLNGKGQVKEETARRVLRAVEALACAPNVSARNLRLNESRVILIVAPNLTNPYYTHVLAGVGKAAHRMGYSAFLCNTEGDRMQTEKVLDMLTRRQADGAILLATERSLRALWEAISLAARTGDWRPRVSRLCDGCDFKALCPAWGGTPPPLPQDAASRALDPAAAGRPELADD